MSAILHVLAVEVGDQDLDPDAVPDANLVLLACAGLVTTVPGHASAGRSDPAQGRKDLRELRLVHFTTHEYFERTVDRWYPKADLKITLVCLTYLAIDHYLRQSYDDGHMHVQLLEYAFRNWPAHAAVVDRDGAAEDVAEVATALARLINKEGDVCRNTSSN
ncbi:hypothetical protein CLAFUW4_10651 [Fulvia fulva]|uniref:Uncharacterized protein n=1 Tax=Passalora fulva TaxID=5499 RepID=A0A9Q8P7T6_PASFU|nr:uncharacterized protein CLAFUR5_05263 [Fulvia fulva]KAK4615681.1 hypothetical protein CLAFUR4_10656 [Fulvia fulva]KAK4616562.1 hypothetical protein CLAFUR0_10588 [Fulvia fulva]UJO16217.1 hypothetical protein CLAFUR5_05263 [Fulvia fulva]WPV18870.1 hypothetical protein CLAFUW4_10651 [Fulvia fulva]WPV34462.1 hypothetical protein CLAFUW7_10653 [Fulvia fulva]